MARDDDPGDAGWGRGPDVAGEVGRSRSRLPSVAVDAVGVLQGLVVEAAGVEGMDGEAGTLLVSLRG